MAAIFLPKARRFDKTDLAEIIQAFPEWAGEPEGYAQAMDYAHAALEGLVINRDIWAQEDQQVLYKFVGKTIAMLRRGGELGPGVTLVLLLDAGSMLTPRQAEDKNFKFGCFDIRGECSGHGRASFCRRAGGSVHQRLRQGDPDRRRGGCSASQSGACENGEERDASGACPVVDDSAAQRGFTLSSGSMAKPPGRRPANRDVRGGQRREGGGSRLRWPSSVACCAISRSVSSRALRNLPLTAMRSWRGSPTPCAIRRWRAGGSRSAAIPTPGSAEKNLALSQARAESVKAFLVAHGVEASRLVAKGYGAEGLAVPDEPRDPRNRRVEARVLNPVPGRGPDRSRRWPRHNQAAGGGMS